MFCSMRKGLSVSTDLPSKHERFNQYCVNVGPASYTLKQYWVNMVNPYPAGNVYICVFKQIIDQINSIQIAKMFRGRCLVNLIITLWRCIFLHKYKYFSSFKAGNCVSNSSSKWMKNSPKQFGCINVNGVYLMGLHKLPANTIHWPMLV